MRYTTALLLPALASCAALSPRIVQPNYNSTSITIGGAESASVADNTALINALETASTAADRLNMLNSNSDFVFDFKNPTSSDGTTTGLGGHTVKADRKGFPALVGTGVGMTVGFLGPCGFNEPHTHPRSAEMNVVVKGALVAEMIPENGVGIVRNRLEQYQATVFPQGAVHTEYNPLCTPSVFVAGFASEDPGVQQSAQTLFGLDDDVVVAALGGMDGTFEGMDVDALRGIIPKNVALGVESCLIRCGIQKRKK